MIGFYTLPLTTGQIRGLPLRYVDSSEIPGVITCVVISHNGGEGANLASATEALCYVEAE